MKKNKSLEGEQKFKPNSFHSNVLNKNSKVYGSDVTLKAVYLY
jgi:transposase-like protein